MNQEHKTAEELGIHMPANSFSPIVLALGLTLAGFGIAFGVWMIALGAVVTLVGLGTWIWDDIKNAAAQSQHDDEGGAGQH